MRFGINCRSKNCDFPKIREDISNVVKEEESRLLLYCCDPSLAKHDGKCACYSDIEIAESHNLKLKEKLINYSRSLKDHIFIEFIPD